MTVFHVVSVSQPASRGHRASAKLRDTPEGPEKFCVRCKEWWPADGEFFQPAKNRAGGLFYCCKACFAEWLRAHRAKQASEHGGARTG